MDNLQILILAIPAGLVILYILALLTYTVRYQPNNQEATFYKGDNLTEEEQQYNYLLMRYLKAKAKQNEIRHNNI